ncbi:hypothetical protein LUZ60_004340 [Juncus effusus]|nr:hypothetical protein LUZ60_004340 [Juncus effusus]
MSTTKPAWGGVGAWALDAERAEAEELEAAAAQPDLFPSLKEAAAAKPKKKKNQPISLAEFTTGSYNKGLTHDEILQLPTGPRERSADEMDRGRLGGGFRNYGGDRRGGGGFDDESRRGGQSQSRVTEYDQPSRADEADNWGRDKKSFPPSDSIRRDRDRYGSLGTGAGAGTGAGTGFSRADETEDWTRGKKPISSSSSSYSSNRNTGFGSGFRDSAASSESDRWGRTGPIPQTQEPNRERRRLILDPPKTLEGKSPVEPARSTRPSPFGSARPREEILKEKGLDYRKMDTEIEQKGSRPSSAQSSRPSSAQSSRPGSPGSLASDGVPRVRSKVNPFGDAKPREVVLEEKGKDWRKIDLELEHKALNRPETNEERALKEEIGFLKTELKETTGSQNPEETKLLESKILQMEKDLELLTIEMDSKAIRPVRPGSGAGRVDPFGENNNSNNSERPRSGGSNREENKWGFQGGPRERNSFAGRNPDRPSGKW